jgi:mannose-1-phosphate guanylyltransferase
VSAFKEKPRALVAQQYYYDRKHLWNSGMFIWSAAAILSSIKKCQPEMHDLLSVYAQKIGGPGENEARPALYKEAESISIDYAVLEQADNVLTLRGDFVWDDVGSWLSLQRFLDISKDGNVVVGKTVQLDTFESTIYNDGNGIIATLGVSDMVIAKAGDAVLVAHKTKLDRIKELLALMAADEQLKKYL